VSLSPDCYTYALATAAVESPDWRVDWALGPGREDLTGTGVLSVGSVFAGVDTLAAHVEWVTRHPSPRGNGDHLRFAVKQGFRYAWCVERNKACRRSLLSSWGPHGLTEEGMMADVGDLILGKLHRVDLLLITPSCCPFSGLYQSGDARDAQADVLADFQMAISAVHSTRPLCVIIEEVATPAAVAAISRAVGYLHSLGYSSERHELCPHAHFGCLEARLRSYWILWLDREPRATAVAGPFLERVAATSRNTVEIADPSETEWKGGPVHSYPPPRCSWGCTDCTRPVTRRPFYARARPGQAARAP